MELKDSIQESDELHQSMEKIKAFIAYFKKNYPSDSRTAIIDQYKPLTKFVVEDWSDIFNETQDSETVSPSWMTKVNVLEQDEQLLESFHQVFGTEYRTFLAHQAKQQD